MALNGEQPVEQQPEMQKIQIYSTSSTGVSPFWRGLSLSLSLKRTCSLTYISFNSFAFSQRSMKRMLRSTGISFIKSIKIE